MSFQNKSRTTNVLFDVALIQRFTHIAPMARTRPSGLPIVEPDSLVIAEELAKIDGRGRLRLLARWTARIAWWSDDDPFDVLMCFNYPGLITLRDWKTAGLGVVTRYEELKQRKDHEALEALRLLADRYQRLRFDKGEMRPCR